MTTNAETSDRSSNQIHYTQNNKQANSKSNAKLKAQITRHLSH